MSQQERYASLADAINPSESARIHLASLKRYLPDVAKGLDDTMKSASVREVHGMLIVESSEYINEGTALALFLNWIIKSRPATVTANIANQMASMAARVFDYPEVKRNERSAKQSDAAKKKYGKTDALGAALRILISERMTNPQILDFLADADAVSNRASKGFPIEVTDEAPDWCTPSDWLHWFPAGGTSENARKTTVKRVKDRLSEVRRTLPDFPAKRESVI